MNLRVPPDEAEEMLFIKPKDKFYPQKGNFYSNQTFRDASPVDMNKYKKYIEKPIKTDVRNYKPST
jgi:hypothetical protein